MTSAAGIGRSLRTYYAPGRATRLDAFQHRFVAPGDLAFDIGAHVGDRTASLRRLGARVIAVEPQPRLARLLRLLFGHDTAVTRVPALVGRATGEAVLHLNAANPTVATASAGFIAAAAHAPGWHDQRWDGALTLPVTTLDALIARHGAPAFVKLDVEGFEAEALAGLTYAPRTISFEFTTIQREVAGACLKRLAALGYRLCNACMGEDMAFVHPVPIDLAAMLAWLGSLPDSANSGDIYSSLESGRLRQ